MKTRRSFLSALLLVCLAAGSSAVQAKTVRLLTIGNSFSANATKHLGSLAKAGGHVLIHGPVVVGGASMELHSERALTNARDPKDKAGLYTNGRSLVQELSREPWDFVTIQQASIKSHDLSTYQPHAGRLRDLVQKYAPTAKLLVHQTWEYRRDDSRFTKPPIKPGEPITQDVMYQSLSAAYESIAKELGARRIPVGDAFHMVDNDPKWAYQPDTTFDFEGAKEPALPNQKNSLHKGWSWKKQKDGRVTLSMDGHHANTAGEYLGGCVFYEVLFGDSAVGNTFIPEGMDAEYARYLQETAHQAVVKAAAKGGSASNSSSAVESMESLVAFWDFQETTGQARQSRGAQASNLKEMKGPVEQVDGGVFGPYSARIKRGQWFMLERAALSGLDIHGPAAQVTVVAWVQREAKDSWQAIAGVWDETHKKRQYCLFLNAPRGTKADEMKRYPLSNRIHGHVSAVGGPTPGEDFCITYSTGATEIPMTGWQCLAMRYDGRESRVYVNGRLDALEQYNPFPYTNGLFDGGKEGADFTVGAVHRGGAWGNFFGGQIGGLAIFNRALKDDEMVKLAALTPETES